MGDERVGEKACIPSTWWGRQIEYIYIDRHIILACPAAVPRHALLMPGDGRKVSGHGSRICAAALGKFKVQGQLGRRRFVDPPPCGNPADATPLAGVRSRLGIVGWCCGRNRRLSSDAAAKKRRSVGSSIPPGCPSRRRRRWGPGVGEDWIFGAVSAGRRVRKNEVGWK